MQAKVRAFAHLLETFTILKGRDGKDYLAVRQHSTLVAAPTAVIDITRLLETAFNRRRDLVGLLRTYRLEFHLVAGHSHQHASGAHLVLVHSLIDHFYALCFLQFLGIVLRFSSHTYGETKHKYT